MLMAQYRGLQMKLAIVTVTNALACLLLLLRISLALRLLRLPASICLLR